MTRTNISPAVTYGVALLAVGVALAIRLALSPLLGGDSLFLLVVLAVSAAGHFGGRGPAIFATLTGCAAVALTFYAADGFALREVTLLAIFVLTSVAITFMCGHLHAARHLAVSRLTELSVEAQKRTLAEFDLGRAQSLLEAVVAQLPVGVIVVDAATGILTAVNDQANVICNAKLEVGTKLSDYYPEESFRLVSPEGDAYAAEQWPLVRALRGETVRGEVLRMLFPDGSQRVLQVNAAPVQDAAGAAIAAVVTVLDVSAREEALAAIEASERELRTLADAMPQIVYASAPGGEMTFINRRWREYTGRDDATAAAVADHLHPEDAGGLFDGWQAAFASGRSFEYEFRLRGKDDQYRWFLTRTVPTRDAGGAITGWYGTSTDIDAHKRLEDDLAAADRRKTVFLAQLGHELRNPLAAVRLAVAVMTRQTDPATVARQAAVVDRQSRLLARLVDDLLDVARIEQGKIQFQPCEVRLGDAIAQAVETSRPLIAAKHHRLNVEVSDGVLVADPDRLAQVVANLLNNAAKYTADGGTLTLEARAAATVEIRVRDTGSGIPPEQIARVFEPFAQVEATRDASQGGMGIGLALVKQLVELHGGTVTAASEGRGRGTEVVVRFPRGDVRDAPAVAVPAAVPLPLPPWRVLVVDDNEDAADSLAGLLGILGCTATTAYCGADALALAEANPDVVFLDLGMPGLSGYDVAAHIRSTEAGRRAVLIALTGRSHAEDREQTRRAGFDFHLVKPTGADELRELLASLAGRPKS